MKKSTLLTLIGLSLLPSCKEKEEINIKDYGFDKEGVFYLKIYNSKHGGFIGNYFDVDGDGDNDVIIKRLNKKGKVIEKQYFENDGKRNYIPRKYPVLD